MNLAAPIRTVLVGDATLATLLAEYNGAPAVFTRRPVPDSYPCAVVSPDVAFGDQDLVNTPFVRIVRDIAVYGENDTPAKYRAVETIAYRIRTLFHRTNVLSVPDWQVVDCVATGPVAAPTDDQTRVGRVVTLTIRMTPAGV